VRWTLTRNRARHDSACGDFDVSSWHQPGMDQSVSNLPAGTNLNGGAAVGSPSREYIYGGGALLAKIDSSGTKYYHQDHLSNRLVTDSSGNTLTQMGHFPFGESWYNATGDKLLFTTYERDAESGNDYAQARYYVNRLALFSALDPLSGSTMDPQTLNRYDYVRDDSIDFLDPTGQFRAAVCIIPAYANCGLGGGVGWSGSWEGELIDFAFTPTGTGWEGDPFLDNLGALGLLGDPGVGGGCTGPLMTGCLVNGACQRP
jgi:RHS repeat-associated protein